MDDAEVQKVIRDYLSQVIHMSLATCVDGRPWVCEVHVAYDNDLNLYWVSSQDRRHSQEVRQNPQVAGNIITQHFLNQKVRGVYFEGQAEQLEGVDKTHPGYQAYAKRFSSRLEMLEAMLKADGPRLL